MKLKIKKERDLENLYSVGHKVLVGGNYRVMTIPDMNKEFGLPKLLSMYNKMEARTGMTARPFIVVNRFVEGRLKYDNGIVVKGVSKSMMDMVEYSGIELVYEMKDDYNPGKMPKATKAEILQWEKRNAMKSHED